MENGQDGEVRKLDTALRLVREATWSQLEEARCISLSTVCKVKRGEHIVLRNKTVERLIELLS